MEIGFPAERPDQNRLWPGGSIPGLRESCREACPGASRPGGPGGLVWAVKNPGFDTEVHLGMSVLSAGIIHSVLLILSKAVIHSSFMLLSKSLIHSRVLVLSMSLIHSSGIGTLSYTNSFCSVVTVHF